MREQQAQLFRNENQTRYVHRVQNNKNKIVSRIAPDNAMCRYKNVDVCSVFIVFRCQEPNIVFRIHSICL